MIQYKIKQYVNKKSDKNGHYLVVPYFTETVDIRGLAKHMAEHNTPYSAGAIRGILTDAVACIRELCLDSKKVKLDDLAIFSIGFKSKLIEKMSEVNGAAVEAFHLNARGTGDFSAQQLNVARQLKASRPYEEGKNDNVKD